MLNVIAGGEISCTSESNAIAYAEINDPGALEKIAKGTIVKLKYEEHLIDIFNDTPIKILTDAFTGCRI